jgi:hypothetical protein
MDDLVSSQCNRLQTGRTEAVDRGAPNRRGQARQHGGDSRDVAALRTMRLPATEHDILYLAGIEAGSLAQNVFDAVGRKIIRASHVERAPERLG